MLRIPLAVLVLCALLGAATFPAGSALAGGYESEVSKIQVVSTVVGGKNVFIPSTIVITGGREHTLSIFNTAEVPHGFRIPALGIETVLPNGEEHEVKIPATEGGRVLQINCHLHEAHRTATLVVLHPADD